MDGFVAKHDVVAFCATADRLLVLAICADLQRHGIYPWSDADMAEVGEWLFRAEESDRTPTKAIAFIGQSGMGDWETEKGALLWNRCVRNKMSIIPVLLPNATVIPDGLGLDPERVVRFAHSVDDELASHQLRVAISGQKRRHPHTLFEIHLEVPAPGTDCFAAAPLRNEEAPIYHWICDAVKASGLKIMQFRRADEDGFSPDVTRAIRAASLVVVDCEPSDQNGNLAPEVIYEWGVAAALGKPTIVVAPEGYQPPLVVTATDMLFYGASDCLDPARFTATLVQKIREITAGLPFPCLIREDLDDIAVVYSDLACLRTTFWKRLRLIFSWGIELYHGFRGLSKQTHKLEQDVRQVRDDVEHLATSEPAALERSWQTFVRTHQMHYLPEHFRFEGSHDLGRDGTRNLIEHAFDFILERSHDYVRSQTEKSRGFYHLACQTYEEYMYHYKEYRSYILDAHVPNLERADRLSFHVCELRRATDRVQDHSRQMMIVLLQVIETERAAREN